MILRFLDGHKSLCYTYLLYNFTGIKNSLLFIFWPIRIFNVIMVQHWIKKKIHYSIWHSKYIMFKVFMLYCKLITTSFRFWSLWRNVEYKSSTIDITWWVHTSISGIVTFSITYSCYKCCWQTTFGLILHCLLGNHQVCPGIYPMVWYLVTISSMSRHLPNCKVQTQCLR